MNNINAGDTAWVLVAAALTMLMTPGLGFFYGGLVRHKNVLSTIMHSFAVLCLVSIQWVLWGYSLAFGPDLGGAGFVGDLSWFGLKGVGLVPNAYAPTVPALAHMAFQMMFAVITPALITGAFAERKRFKAFVFFTIAWSTLVYDPVAHWVWGQGGWLNRMGMLDFAGGAAVEIGSGVSALVAAYVLGPRILHKQGDEAVQPHDVPMVVLGAALLWFGWFGFNAGSALAANGVAALAFVNTNTAGAMAALVWMTITWVHKGSPSVVGATVGAIAGMVAITPAAGFVEPMAAVIIGGVAAAVCYYAVQLRDRMNVDDTLDVWAVHGMAGTVGLFLLGFFAVKSVNVAAGADGFFAGNPHQLVVESIGILAAWAYCAVMTFAILKFINTFVGLRVSEKDEAMGLDVSQHSETAYGA